MSREFYVLYEGETVRRNLDMLLGALEKQFEGRILVVEQVLRVRTDVESLFPMLEELGMEVGEKVTRKRGKKNALGVIVDPDPRFGGKGHRLPEVGPGESPGSAMVEPGSAIPTTTPGQDPGSTIPATATTASECLLTETGYLVKEEKWVPAKGICPECGEEFMRRTKVQKFCGKCSRERNPKAYAYASRKVQELGEAAEKVSGQGIKGKKLG